MRQGKLEEAEDSYREALRLKPDYAEAHNNLGNVLWDQGKLEEAEASYREALRLKPDYAEAHTNLGFYWLLHGNFAQGWPEYEWRRLTKDNRRHAPPPPSWDGSALDGQTILLQAEQGLGDAFQFVRYARLVKAKGGRVVLQCQPALAGILAGCPGIDQVVPAGTPLPPYHVTAPLLSLPSAVQDHPGNHPRRRCPTSLPTLPRVASWRARLAVLPGFKVGICWQGNPKFKGDRLRSVPLASFAPLAAVPGVCLVALQRGPGLEQIAQQSEHLKVVDLPRPVGRPGRGLVGHGGLDSGPGPGGQRRYRGGASGRGPGSCGVGSAALHARLALAFGPGRQPLVSDAAAVPPAPTGRLVRGIPAYRGGVARLVCRPKRVNRHRVDGAEAGIPAPVNCSA